MKDFKTLNEQIMNKRVLNIKSAPRMSDKLYLHLRCILYTFIMQKIFDYGV